MKVAQAHGEHDIEDFLLVGDACSLVETDALHDVEDDHSTVIDELALFDIEFSYAKCEEVD